MSQKIGPSQIKPLSSVDANGWTVNDFGTHYLYTKSFTFSSVSVPSGAGSGATAVNINLPVGVTVSDDDVVGESTRCGTAEVSFTRIDSLSSGTRRLYAVNSTSTARTVAGLYRLI